MINDLKKIIEIEGITREETSKERRKRKQKEWVSLNKEKLKESRRKYYQKNKEIFAEKYKTYYQTNVLKIKEYQKQYAKEHEDIIKKRAKKRRKKNAKSIKAYLKEWYKVNKEKVSKKSKIDYIFYKRERILKRYHENREELILKNKLWKANNKDKLREYNEKNRSSHNAALAKYRANKRNATPKWLTTQDLLDINSIYKESHRLTKESGVVHCVDHFYPLKSDWVCGLHCPSNLQIITLSENSSKHNRKINDHIILEN